MKGIALFFVFILFSSSIFSQNFNETKIIAPDGVEDDSFGIVQIKYPFLFVGAVGVGSGQLDTRGAVYFYKHENEKWIFKQKIIGPSNTSAFFGRNLTVKDSFLFVGASYDTVKNISCGAVHVYKIYEDSLSYFQKLYPPESYLFAEFGWDIDIFENKLIIGAPYDDSLKGAVHIFHFDGNYWVYNKKISDPNSIPYSSFGQSVAIGENIICVGAPEINSNGDHSGIVVFYKFENNEWVYKQTMVGSKVSAEHYFGGHLSLYQNKLAVSAEGNIYSFNYGGAVYLFNLIDNEWIEENIITNDSEDDHFGMTVLIREDTLIVGSTYQTGRGYFYIRDGNEWKLQNIFTASDSHLNNSFADESSADAGFIAFGASSQKINRVETGAVYIYSDKTTSINDNPAKIINFDLFQNYPNPFNPTTKIKFSIPEPNIVKIKVYDLLGKEIQTLLNEYKPIGSYEVDFDAISLPSVVYLYRITSGSYSETKKMILLR